MLIFLVILCYESFLRWLILIKWVSGITYVWELDYIGLVLIALLFFWSVWLLYFNHFVKLDKVNGILYMYNLLWSKSYWISEVEVSRVAFNKKLIYTFHSSWRKNYVIDLTTNPSLTIKPFKNWKWIDFYWWYETYSDLWKITSCIKEYDS